MDIESNLTVQEMLKLASALNPLTEISYKGKIVSPTTKALATKTLRSINSKNN